ncbi:unnamed protein product, partial [Musa banksii]
TFTLSYPSGSSTSVVQCGCPAFPYKVDILVLLNLCFRLYISA